MLPLSHKDTLHRSFGSRIKEKIHGWMRLIFSDRNSRNLFLFLILNLSFAFVELVYGVWSNSLGKNNFRTKVETKLTNFCCRFDFGLFSHVL